MNILWLGLMFVTLLRVLANKSSNNYFLDTPTKISAFTSGFTKYDTFHEESVSVSTSPDNQNLQSRHTNSYGEAVDFHDQTRPVLDFASSSENALSREGSSEGSSQDSGFSTSTTAEIGTGSFNRNKTTSFSGISFQNNKLQVNNSVSFTATPFDRDGDPSTFPDDIPKEHAETLYPSTSVSSQKSYLQENPVRTAISISSKVTPDHRNRQVQTTRATVWRSDTSTSQAGSLPSSKVETTGANSSRQDTPATKSRLLRDSKVETTSANSSRQDTPATKSRLLRDSKVETTSANSSRQDTPSTKSRLLRDSKVETTSARPDTSTAQSRLLPKSKVETTSVSSQQQADTSTDHTGPLPNSKESIADDRMLMERLGLVPLAIVGMGLNLASLWVWQGDKAYNATTFLFKYLAVWDSLCLFTLILFVNKLHEVVTSVSLHTSNVSQRVSVHTTLLVSVTRYLAVWRPLHVRSLLSAATVRSVCLALFVWCLLLEALNFYSSYGNADKETSWAVYYSQRVLGLALPLVVTLVFNVMLIVKACRPRHNAGLTGHQEALEARYHLTWPTVCISICSLVAYPVSVCVETVTNVQCWEGNLYVCDRFFIYTIKFSTFVLQVINLGINFVFYAAFTSRFRHLLVKKLRRCCGSCCRCCGCWWCRCCRRRDDVGASSSGGSSGGSSEGVVASVQVISFSRKNVNLD